jgi:hypothetical protein
MLRRWNLSGRVELSCYLVVCLGINSSPRTNCLPMHHAAACFVVAFVIAAPTYVAAQGLSAPGGGMEVGSGGGLKPPTNGSAVTGEATGVQRHLGPTGKPCLSVKGNGVAEKINPSLFAHMIVAANACGERIKLDVCYYQSRRCVEMDIPPYGRSEMTLGIMPSMSGFRFEFREQFNSFESSTSQ